MLLRVLHLICQQIQKTQQWSPDWKWSVFSPIPKKGNARGCSNSQTSALILHATKLCSKSSKLGFSSTWIKNFQMYKLGLGKAEGSDQIANICRIIVKARKSRKTSTSASMTMLKPLTVWITTNCEKFLRRWEYQTLPAT